MPDAPAATLDLADRLTRALCILSSDAVDSGSTSVRVQLASARDELDLYHSGTVARLLQDLLIHVALESLPAATYLILPAPRRDYAEAWARAFALTDEEERRTLGIEVPTPSTPPLDVLRGLVASLERHAARPGKGSSGSIDELGARLWRIRHGRLAGELGPVELEAAFEGLLGQLSRLRGERARSLRLSVLGDLLAHQLDRGQLLAAQDTVRRAGPTAQRPADVRGPMDLLALIVKWMVGDPAMPALESAFEKVSARTVAPAAWVDLVRCVRADRSREPDPSGSHRAAPSAIPLVPWTAEVAVARRSWGASAVIVSMIQPNGGLEVVSRDVAPGLQGHVDAWVTRHGRALAERGTPEHEVGCRAAPLVLVSTPERPEHAPRMLQVSLARGAQEASFAQPMALVVEPILDADGEPAGLLWMEFPTRWIPASTERAAAARALFARFGGAPASEVHSDASSKGAERTGWSIGLDGDPPEEPAHHTPQARQRARAASWDLRAAWDRALAALQVKTAERRWIAFQVDGFQADGDSPGATLRWVADGGEAGDRLGAPTNDGTWAIRRSLRTGGAIRYGLDQDEGEHPEPAMLHRGAASGAAIPLHRSGRVIAVLSLESVRRGDARESDVERWYESLQASGPMLEATILSGHDRRGFDGGFAFSDEDPEFLAEHESLCVMGRSNADVLIGGESGTGRRTLARMIHHASRRMGDAAVRASERSGLVVRAAFGLEAEELRQIVAAPDLATLALSDIEWLSPAAQAALSEACMKPQGQRPRVVATVGSAGLTGLAVGSREDGLHPQLVRQLGRATLRCPSLRDRRHIIPGLAAFLLRRMVDREGGTPVDLDDAAQAVLWRQPWAQNIASLDAVLYGLFLRMGQGGQTDVPDRAPGASPRQAGAEATVEAILDAGLEVTPRLPSRAPLESDLRSALWVTRTATRRFNKTRAAMYLGWDPNTLAARLKDQGLNSLDEVHAALRKAAGRSARNA